MRFATWLPLMLLCLLEAGGTAPAAASPATIAVPFYSDTLTLAYDPAAVPSGPLAVGQEPLRAEYERLRRSPWQTLHRSLQQARRDHGLNDWLTYRLLTLALERLLGPDHPNCERFLAWFYLGQSGYDPRLAFHSGELNLYAHTRDTLYGKGFLRLDGREYIKLDGGSPAGWTGQAQELFQWHPWTGGRAFAFALDRLPELRAEPVRKRLSFRYGADSLSLPLTLDATAVDLMSDYPPMGERNYLHVPLSAAARASLVEGLAESMRGMAEAEAVRFLVSFTRTAFAYREDEAQFGRSKPMTAEETLFFPASDCEDRCALLYQLVRELLDLPMIAVAYPDHLTIGIALKEAVGDPLYFRGRPYYLCDPTGPAENGDIGRLPERFDRQPYSILSQ